MEDLIKIKNKLLLISLISMLSTNISACGNSNDLVEDKVVYTESISMNNDDLESIVESSEDEEVIVEDVIIDSKEEIMNLVNSGAIKKIYYATEDIDINIPAYLSSNNVEETITLPRLECLEVYDQVDDICLVKTNEYIGYVTTDNLKELLGTFVVIDISNQELKLYCDNEVILTSPVVTGKPSTPSDQGLFEIYNISGPRYLIGPNYKTYVDVMMKYNGGEGLHDAQYHQHDDGFKHGWRSLEEFGGETYLTDGSHGCVNMIRDDVMMVKEYVEVGTKVLVKQ